MQTFGTYARRSAISTINSLVPSKLFSVISAIKKTVLKCFPVSAINNLELLSLLGPSRASKLNSLT